MLRRLMFFRKTGMSKAENESEAASSETQTAGDPTGASGPSAATPDAPAISAEDLAALRAKAAESDALRERALRAMADLDNLRKRSARERQEAIQYANQSLMERLVPALDNLDMALAAVGGAQAQATVESLKTGVEMVLGQLKGVLRDAGLEEIDAQGQPFDPTWHEAVSQVESLDVPEGHVLQQLRKGYKLQQRLIRPATVVVARPPQG
ncbi:MAG: nucleotide exchange factor GrpE [Verrucomicrobiales bacterium]|nr:nucleotide exchange factor GrpE [Verrucomicrobiales bacterium]